VQPNKALRAREISLRPRLQSGAYARRSASPLEDPMRALLYGIAILAFSPAAMPAVPEIPDAIDPSAPCLNYDDAAVTISGTVFSRIYFGPPGYGETPAQDRRERATLLLLDAPICVKTSPHPELDNNSFEGNVILIQLAAVHVKPELLEKAHGQRATARGSLFHQLTGHHRTVVLMDVHSIEVP
jgi:hypothetical protein